MRLLQQLIHLIHIGNAADVGLDEKIYSMQCLKTPIAVVTLFVSSFYSEQTRPLFGKKKKDANNYAQIVPGKNSGRICAE